MPYRDLEPAVAHIGRELQAHVRQRRSRRDRAEQRLLDLVVAEPAARARLFQLVDAFPALRGSEDVSDHIAGYLDDEGVPAPLRLAVRASRRVPGGDRVSVGVARRGITHMASRFIAGTDAAAARPTFERIWAAGMGVIVDLLGEKTITQPDADRYAARVAGLIDDLRATPGEGRRSIAIKPTALAPRLHPLTAEAGLAEARERLVPILRAATAADLLVWFDMEQYDVKDLTLALFRDLLGEPELAATSTPASSSRPTCGTAPDDLADLMAWSRGAPPADHRAPGEGRVLGRRDGAGPGRGLARAGLRAQGRDRRQLRALRPACSHDHHGEVRAAFALAQPALARLRRRRTPTTAGIPDTGYEMQMLYGMAEPHARRRPRARPAARACTRRSASSCRAWPTSCGGCWRTRPTRASCATASPRARRSTSCSRRPRRRRAARAGAAGGRGRPTDRRPSRRPYEPEPVGEWRRRGGAGRASPPRSSRRRRPPALDVPAVIGGERVATDGARSTRSTPAAPTASSPRRASCDGRRRRRGRRRPRWRVRRAGAATPGRRAGRACCSGRRRGCARGATSSPRSRSSRRASRGPRPTPTCARPSTSASTTAARCSRLDRRRRRAVAAGRAQPARATRRGASPSVIAPWNFPLAIPTRHGRPPRSSPATR